MDKFRLKVLCLNGIKIMIPQYCQFNQKAKPRTIKSIINKESSVNQLLWNEKRAVW